MVPDCSKLSGSAVMSLGEKQSCVSVSLCFDLFIELISIDPYEIHSTLATE